MPLPKPMEIAMQTSSDFDHLQPNLLETKFSNTMDNFIVSWNHLSWKGPLKVIWSNSPAMSRDTQGHQMLATTHVVTLHHLTVTHTDVDTQCALFTRYFYY